MRDNESKAVFLLLLLFELRRRTKGVVAFSKTVRDTALFRWVPQKHGTHPLMLQQRKSPNLDFLIFTWHIFLSLRHHVTASRLKIHPTAATATRQNISIPVDGICLRPRDPSGAGCHVSNWPRLGTSSAKRVSLRRDGGGRWGRNRFPARYFNQSWQLWRSVTLQSKPKWVCGGVERFERSFYLQDERCEVWSVRAQIRYCLQFVVVQLSVHVREKETVKKNSLDSDKVCLENPVFTLESAENTRHTYISLRCCSLENSALSSTCNLLWLRSLWREKRQKLREKYTPWSVFLSCCTLPFGPTQQT